MLVPLLVTLLFSWSPVYCSSSKEGCNVPSQEIKSLVLMIQHSLPSKLFLSTNVLTSLWIHQLVNMWPEAHDTPTRYFPQEPGLGCANSVFTVTLSHITTAHYETRCTTCFFHVSLEVGWSLSLGILNLTSSNNTLDPIHPYPATMKCASFFASFLATEIYKKIFLLIISSVPKECTWKGKVIASCILSIQHLISYFKYSSKHLAW